MILLFLYTLYILFIACMATKAVWDELALGVKIILAPMGILAWLMDFSLNMAATFIFFNLPKELMFTRRMGRYIKTKDRFREKPARFICKYLLDPFEVGGHCDYGN